MPTYEEAESLARKLLESAGSMPIEEIQPFLENMEATYQAMGIPESAAEIALRPFRERLVGAALEQLADEGWLERRGLNDEGAPLYRGRKPS